MKKLLLSITALALAFSTMAQAPRTQLYEVFSGENCPPCVPSNVYVKNLMDANPNTIIPIKYQVPIPSAGPIHLENPTETNGRRSYYGVNSAPNARHDGTTIGTGHGSNITQALINTRATVSSPFTIAISHEFNATWDTMFVTMTITAAQAVNSGTWFARVAMIERHMSFASPPGTNGETDFYDVMRKMIPNINGTALPSTWTSGQSVTLNLSTRVPAYIRDIAEVAAIGFVQNDVNKEVAQAAKTTPLPVPIYSKASLPGTGGFYYCSANAVPEMEVENIGTQAITAMEIRQTNGTNTQTVNWSGSLTAGTSTTVTLNPTPLSTGRSTFQYQILTMNGLPHPSVSRSTIGGTMYVGDTPIPDVNQGFVGTFPPVGWAADNRGSTTQGWLMGVPGANGTNRSARQNWYDIPNGDIKDLYMPRMDMSVASVSANLSFYVAHAQFNAASNDRLIVQGSTDCGETWVELFNKAGSQLSTRPPQSGAYLSPTASEWRQEIISLSQFATQPDVLIRFRAISNYGNNLFLDEVFIPNTVSVKENASAELILNSYPNPVQDVLFIDYDMQQHGELVIDVHNQLGQSVLRESLMVDAGTGKVSVQLGHLNSGIYTIKTVMNGKLHTNKVVKQ
ncbi:MAG: T9SS type A sorting domain-containing protein [Bacteroidia bacterium]